MMRLKKISKLALDKKYPRSRLQSFKFHNTTDSNSLTTRSLAIFY